MPRLLGYVQTQTSFILDDRICYIIEKGMSP